jgi:hypothetical protein
MKYLIVGLFTALLSTHAWAVDRLVPSQFASIQAAHNAASPGDRILVSPGNYDETVTISKDNLEFISTVQYGAKLRGGNTRVNGFVNGASNTTGVTIDGFDIFGQTGRAISLPEGVTGQDGWTFRRNRIHHVRQFGIYARGNNHLAEDNYIYLIGNTAEAYAMYFFSAGSVIRRNVVHSASKNNLRMRNASTADSNLFYHGDTCLAVNGGNGGDTIYNNYIYDCLSAVKPKHLPCTDPKNNGRVRVWHNTITDFGNSAVDIGENLSSPQSGSVRTACVDVRNNVFHRNTARGDAAVFEKRDIVDNTVLDGNFYDLNGLPLYRNATNNNDYTTLAQLRSNFGYETNGVVGNSGLVNLQEGVFYNTGSPVLNGGPTLSSPYGNQMGARNIVQTTPKIVYIQTLKAINASANAAQVGRLTDGQKIPIWTPNNTSGWVVLEVNNGASATFGYFSMLGISLDRGSIRQFTLQSGPSANGPWTTVTTDGGNTGTGGSYSFFELPSPVTTPYLRFNYLNTFNNINVELGELDVYNMVPQNSTPPPCEVDCCANPPCDGTPPPPNPVDHAPPPLFTGGEGTGTQRFISPGGGGNACSVGTPCSWTTAINASQPNDAVIFTNGTYPITLATVRSGLEGRHIVIKAQNEGMASITGSAQDQMLISHSYITVRGLKFFDTKTGFPNASFPGGSLSTMHIDNSSGAHHHIIENNTFEHCANICFAVLGSTNINTHLIIRNNIFDGAGYKADHSGRPVRISSQVAGAPGAENVVIYGNTIMDFTGPAIEVSQTGKKVWIFENTIHTAATAASHGTSPEPPRLGLIHLRGSETYFYNNIVRDAAFGTKMVTVRNSATSIKNLIYNNVFDTITGNDDAVFCETGNIGPAAEVYNNTFWGLTDHTVGVVDCPVTVVNNIGINGVTNNLATADFNSTYFNDAAAGDFTLTVNAVNAFNAVSVAPWSTTDKSGKGIVGSAKDYGAYEYGGFPPPPPPTSGFPTTSVLDNFNRGVTENPIAGIWVNGATGVGSCQVISDTMRRSTGTFDCYVGTQYGATQEVYVTLPNATNHGDTTSGRLRACLLSGSVGTTSANGYNLRLQKNAALDRLSIEDLGGGIGVQLGDVFEIEISNGHKIGLEVLAGGTLNAWADTGTGWELKFTRTDPTPHDCTNSYVGASPAGNANYHYEDFGGGTSVTVSPGNLLVPPILFFD